MKRLAFISFSLFAFAGLGLGLGCGGTPETGGTGGAGGCDNGECELSNQCALNYFCDTGCCMPWDGCTADSCAADEVCDTETYTCIKAVVKCDQSACECHIVDSAGQMSATEAPGEHPKIVLAAGATHDVQVVVGVVNGITLPPATVTLNVSDTALFTLSGNSLTAEAGAGGTATLTATIDGIANTTTCTADLQNLGDAPSGGQVRFFVFDDLTGAPIRGATVIVDNAGDGQDHGSAPATDTAGLTTTTAAPGGSYDVTVFAAGYNYLSIIGLDGSSGGDVALPISARPAIPLKSGYSGQMDFQKYEDRYLDGRGKAVVIGIASGSIPIISLLNFDLSLLVGEIGGKCGKTPDPAHGCYEINFPGFDAQVAPLPGGVHLELSNAEIKGPIDVVSVPGRRAAWSLAGELEIGDLSGLIGIVLDMVADCACDTTSKCDKDGSANCACDGDCGTQFDFGEIFDALLPLFVKFASGVHANLPLGAAGLACSETGTTCTIGGGQCTSSATDECISEWDYWVGSDSYPLRLANAKFPRLDDSTAAYPTPYGRLDVVEALSDFSNFTAPALPSDPGTGTDMEGLLVLTGVNAPGQGFVPLGLSAGIDCTKGDCLDRQSLVCEGTNTRCTVAGSSDSACAAGVNCISPFDGKVNGARMCTFDADPLKNGCPPNVPDQVPDGNIGLFSAPAHSGLAGEWLTVVAALPLSQLASSTSSGFRAAGYVVRQQPAANGKAAASNQLTACADCTFPPIPSPIISNVVDSAGRVSAFDIASSGHELHWLTAATQADPNGQTTRWNIYAGAGGGTFHPPVPTGDDPFVIATGVCEGRATVCTVGGTECAAELFCTGTDTACTAATVATDCDVPGGQSCDPRPCVSAFADIPINDINVTHLGFNLINGAPNLAAMADLGDGTTLLDLVSGVAGLAANSDNVCALTGGTCP